MRRGLLSLAAIVLAIPVLLGAAQGSVSLEAASVRVVVLAVAVGLLDRYAGPIGEALLRVLDDAEPAGGAAERDLGAR